MHAAPPVAVRCTAGWAWRGLHAVPAALAAGGFLFWSLATWAADAAPPLRWGPALLSGLTVGALVWWRSARPAQALDWDGQRWAVDGRAGPLQLMIDLGGALLLRHRGRCWLLVGRRDAGSAWHALRVAVYARSAGTTDDGWSNA